MAFDDPRVDYANGRRGRRRGRRWGQVVDIQGHRRRHEDLGMRWEIHQGNVIAVFEKVIKSLPTETDPKGGETRIDGPVHYKAISALQIVLDRPDGLGVRRTPLYWQEQDVDCVLGGLVYLDLAQSTSSAIITAPRIERLYLR